MTTNLNPLATKLLSILVLAVYFNSCSNGAFEYSVATKLNPFEYAPLTAMLKIESSQPCRAAVKVLGQIPVEQSYEIYSDKLDVPVVGLYPGRVNKVELTLRFESGEVKDTIDILTAGLPNYFPRIEINKLDRSKMEPGMHLCDIHYAKQGSYDSRPLIFDDMGEVRWYLDLSFFGDIIWPIQRLKNGNLLVGGLNIIYEYDMLGQELRKDSINPQYRIHHDIVELPNGDLLMAVRKGGSLIEINGIKEASYNDFMILYDRTTSKVIKEWDLAKHLDVSRDDLNANAKGDWLHMNGLAFDQRDSSIIVSCRKQGMAKISWQDELVWIMAPKKNWGKSGRDGNGFDTNPFLLSAIDGEGKPYNQEVQQGNESPENFDFPWGQHAPKLMPNGNILLFDNGYFRNYNLSTNYSRAVEYKVNEVDRTVEQVWQHGKERGAAFFSMLISDADYLEKTNNILITSGFISHNAKILEVSYPGKEEVFEATLYFNTLNGSKTFAWGQLDILYRSERFELKY